MSKIITVLVQMVTVILLAAVWLTLGMVYLERFIPPFNFLVPWVMPWKGVFGITGKSDSVDRFSSMQDLLDTSYVVSNTTFFLMIGSFFLLSIYLTFTYQQKQRRSREFRLLQLKNKEIAQRNEFIQYISATIGHEFKNNLGRIKRRIDLLSSFPQDSRRHIYNNLNKLFTDIEIFKDISDKREAGLVDFSEINLVKMFTELSEQNSDFADVIIEEQYGYSPLFASYTLMKTVFENLMDNAIKYKKPVQDRARITISFSIDKDGNRRYATILFKDEGIGMDEWAADQCFYKAKATHGGWGKGLYFAKYVVGLHAGKIRIGKEYTQLGVGTEVIINLPLPKEGTNV